MAEILLKLGFIMSFSFVAIKKVTKIVLQCFKPLSPFFFDSIGQKRKNFGSRERSKD